MKIKKGSYASFLVLLVIIGVFHPITLTRATDHDSIYATVDVGWAQNTENYYSVFIRFDISSLAGLIIESAELSLYVFSTPCDSDPCCVDDGDVRFWRVDNQVWTESTDSSLLNETRDTQTEWTGSIGDGRNLFDLSSIVAVDVNAGNGFTTIRYEDPDGALTYPFTGSATKQTGTSLVAGINDYPNTCTEWGAYAEEYGSATYDPILEVTTSQPVGTWRVDYDYSNMTDQSNNVIPEKHWNGTQLLYRIFLYPYEADCAVNVSGIDTSYSFAYINPDATKINNITSAGWIQFTELNGSMYEVVFDPNQDWHTLHISLYAPDGVGLMWESFQIYINDTRVPYPPAYQIQTGYYEYTVKDYFSQTVLASNFTISSSMGVDVYQNWEVPLYLMSFHNADQINYYVKITRNSITRTFPLPPKGETTARLYGLSTNVDYTITIYKSDTDEFLTTYTLSMPALPKAQYINFDNDEQINFPTYQGDFEALKNDIQTQVYDFQRDITQLVLLSFIGLFAALIVQRYAIFKSLFSRPLFSDRRNRR